MDRHTDRNTDGRGRRASRGRMDAIRQTPGQDRADTEGCHRSQGSDRRVRWRSVRHDGRSGGSDGPT
eukprot:681474-Rhodomonas_salina.1